eukprot:1157829-Pelagomonas_calceolata.AAC.6
MEQKYSRHFPLQNHHIPSHEARLVADRERCAEAHCFLRTCGTHGNGTASEETRSKSGTRK